MQISTQLHDLNDMFKTQKGKNKFQKLIEKWYKEDEDDRIKSNWVISKFCFYKKNKMLRFPYNDVFHLIDIRLVEVEKELTKIDALYQNKEKKLDKKVYFENEEILVLTPLTYECAQKYGANTRWCVSSRHSKSMYDALCTGNNKCYMFCPKKNEEKHILYVNNDNAFEFTDKKDTFLKKSDYLIFLKKYQILNTFCSINPTCLKEYYYIRDCMCFYCNEGVNCDKRESEELRINLIKKQEIYIA